MKVVIDTNIFVSALISKDGICRKILRLCFEGKISPLMSHPLFSEYEELILRPNLFADCPIDYKKRIELLESFLAVCTWTGIYYLWRPNLQDEADNHLIELAVAGGANTIITYNISDLKSGSLIFKDLKIVTPQDFIGGLK